MDVKLTTSVSDSDDDDDEDLVFDRVNRRRFYTRKYPYLEQPVVINKKTECLTGSRES